MEKITLPKIKEEKIDKFSSKFTIEPLYPGYGPTLGNSLRRVLLSSLPGAAVTSFKVEGISHEFSALPHVKEDLIEIMLNMKSIKIKSFSDEPVFLKLSKNGPDTVTAADFAKNEKIEIINPDQKIATLDKKAKFELVAKVEKDKGFRPTENFKDGDVEIGDILIDADFSPIDRVKMEVTNTRVGRMTNYDKLVLLVITNGSISAKEAMIDASNILIDHFKVFAFDLDSDIKLTEEQKSETDVTEDTGEEIKEAKKVQIEGKTKIEDAALSARTTNALINAGVKTVAGVLRLSDLKMSEVKGLGNKGILEIKEKLSA